MPEGPQKAGEPPLEKPPAGGGAASVPWALWVILACGLLVRAALWLVSTNAPPTIVDAQHYDGLAARLVERGAFVEENGSPASMRPPLYPLLVSLVYRVAGIQTYSAVYAMQAVLSLVTTWLVYRLGAAAFRPAVGVCAAGLFWLYPSFLAYNQLLLTEPLATLLLVAAWLCGVYALERVSWSQLVASGVFFGLAALTRSATLLFMPFYALLLLFAWPGRVRIRLGAPAVAIAAFAATIGPWAYRNTLLHQTPTFIDVMGGRNAMMGNYEFTPLERSWAAIGVTGDESWDSVLRRSDPEAFARAATQGMRDKLALRYALRFMLGNPGLTAQRTLVKFFNFWQLEREIIAGAKVGMFGPLARSAVFLLVPVICGYYALCLFAAVFGALLRPAPGAAVNWFFFLSVAVPCAAHALIFAHSRYHLPLVPILLLYAASAIISRREILQSRRSGSFIAGVAICSILVLAWLRELVFVDLGKLL